MRKPSKEVVAVILAAGVLLLPVIASAAISAASKAEVEFVAVGPAGLRIVGESKSLQVHDDAQALSFVVPLSALETGIGLRDRHMKDKYLEVPRYPNATLKVDRKALQFPAAGAKIARDATGEFTLHGKTKRLPFHYEASASGSGFDVEAKASLNMTDFGIEAPSYMGMHVKPLVEISVRFHAAGN